MIGNTLDTNPDSRYDLPSVLASAWSAVLEATSQLDLSSRHDAVTEWRKI